MKKRTLIYTRLSTGQAGLEAELRRTVEHHGDMVIAAYQDDGSLTGRGKFSGWRALLANLNVANQVSMSCAGDIPGTGINDLLKILGTFQDYGISLRLHRERIDTGDGAAAVLDLIAAYRMAKVSQAIRHGQKRAVANGRRPPGRPSIPQGVVTCIQVSLKSGAGIRPTARKHKVSPGSVMNIRRMMESTTERLAA